MKTLIELYDRAPAEKRAEHRGTLPERTVFICTARR